MLWNGIRLAEPHPRCGIDGKGPITTTTAIRPCLTALLLAFLIGVAGCQTTPKKDTVEMKPQTPQPSTQETADQPQESAEQPQESTEQPQESAEQPQESASMESIVWRCSADGLHPSLIADLQQVATLYVRETGRPIVVNSGRRTLRHQARLMADFTVEQLEGMYCNYGYPSYIRDIAEARQDAEEPLSIDKTYDILRARTEGYISTHLFGGAVDISPHDADVPLLKKLLRDHGFRVLDERNLGVQCIHATHTEVPKTIVRE